MIPLIMAAISLAQKKQQQNQADNEKISNSLNLGDRGQQQNTQLEVPNGNPMNSMMGGGQQGGAMGLLGSLFNKNDPTKTAMPNRF